MGKLLESVRAYTNKDGYILSSVFAKVPSRREVPDYNQVIAQPMDLSMIEANVENGTYGSMAELMADLDLMFKNAMTYNPRGHPVHTDAAELKKYAHKRNKELEPELEPPADLTLVVATPPPPAASASKKPAAESSPAPPASGGRSVGRPKASAPASSPAPASEPNKQVDQLMHVVNTATAKDGHLLSEWFELLPSRREYPDYYQIIQHPIDLKTIRQRVAKNSYKDVDALYADFKQMFDNAKFFNDPASDVYKDTVLLQKKVDKEHARLQADQASPPSSVAGHQRQMKKREREGEEEGAGGEEEKKKKKSER